MKTFIFIITYILSLSLLSAQSIVGTWKLTGDKPKMGQFSGDLFLTFHEDGSVILNCLYSGKNSGLTMFMEVPINGKYGYSGKALSIEYDKDIEKQCRAAKLKLEVDKSLNLSANQEKELRKRIENYFEQMKTSDLKKYLSVLFASGQYSQILQCNEEKLILVGIRNDVSSYQRVMTDQQEAEFVLRKKQKENRRKREQDSIQSALRTEKVFDDKTIVQNAGVKIINREPEFPGGFNALAEYISTNLHYPEIASRRGIEGKVVVSFFVEKDGSLTDFAIESSPDEILSQEAMRICKIMPFWEPARRGEKPIRSNKQLLPITFKL